MAPATWLYARVRVLVHILHARPRVQRAPGFPCALCIRRDKVRLQSSGASRREIMATCPIRTRNTWLPPRNDCCVLATVPEDLTVPAAGSCLRRFLATPLHEIISFVG